MSLRYTIFYQSPDTVDNPHRAHLRNTRRLSCASITHNTPRPSIHRCMRSRGGVVVEGVDVHCRVYVWAIIIKATVLNTSNATAVPMAVSLAMPKPLRIAATTTVVAIVACLLFVMQKKDSSDWRTLLYTKYSPAQLTPVPRGWPKRRPTP